MSNFTPLKQSDPRWGSMLIKPSNLTIAGYGCTITCVSMLARTTPDVVVNKASFTSGGLIIWESLTTIGLKLIKRERNKWDNNEVTQAIQKYGACLGEVVHPSGFLHWLLMIGDKKMIDPLSGKVEATSKYSNYVGYCILEPLQTNNNDMTDIVKKYGCKTVEELDSKIFENTGLDWGNENNKDNKSHLASERRKTTKLEAQLADKDVVCQKQLDVVTTKLNAEIKVLKAKLEVFEKQEEKPIDQPECEPPQSSSTEETPLEKEPSESKLTWIEIFEIIKNKLLGE